MPLEYAIKGGAWHSVDQCGHYSLERVHQERCECHSESAPGSRKKEDAKEGGRNCYRREYERKRRRKEIGHVRGQGRGEEGGDRDNVGGRFVSLEIGENGYEGDYGISNRKSKVFYGSFPNEENTLSLTISTKTTSTHQ